MINPSYFVQVIAKVVMGLNQIRPDSDSFIVMIYRLIDSAFFQKDVRYTKMRDVITVCRIVIIVVYFQRVLKKR